MTNTQLLREAAEWRLIGLLLECPAHDWQQQITMLAGEITDPDLQTAVTYARAEAHEGLYHSIFGPGGPAPPREISYRHWVQPGYLLSELMSYYQSFSYHPPTLETPDHVAVEAGFVGYLRMKEVYALTCGASDQAAISQEAARRFVEDHLSFVAGPLAKELASSGVNYLMLTGAALVKRVGPPKSTPHGLNLPLLAELEEPELCGASDYPGVPG